MTERRRYRANMPESAWPNGRPPRPRRRLRDARNDLAIGMGRYLKTRDPMYAAQWAAYALRVGAGVPGVGKAPDGSGWGVSTVVDYL